MSSSHNREWLKGLQTEGFRAEVFGLVAEPVCARAGGIYDENRFARFVQMLCQVQQELGAMLHSERA